MAGDESSRLRHRRASESDNVQVDGSAAETDSPHKNTVISRSYHCARQSPFSSTSGFKDYSGILNWGLVLLVLAGSRLALENVLKYGILISPKKYFLLFWENPFSWPLTFTLIYVNLHIAVALLCEKNVVREVISDKFAHRFLVFNLAMLIVVPAAIILYIPAQPQSTVPALAVVTIVFLKLISYKQVNSAYRVVYLSELAGRAVRGRTKSSATLSSAEKSYCPVVYPFNLRWRNMYYFMLSPTLCYELEYPTTSSFNSWFFVRRSAEVLFLSSVLLAFFQQWILPALVNSNELFLTMDYSRLTEKLLKLAVPNQILWLLFFYLYFHSALNALAELTGFADREFYLDWWNSRNQAEFWQKWNIPVHKWGKRHIYKVLLQKGYSKSQGYLVVFLVSAFFHEYLVSVPLKMFRVWIFLGMISQMPLAVLSLNLSPRQGNILMWLSLMLGQPAIVFMYYHDYYLTYVMH